MCGIFGYVGKPFFRQSAYQKFLDNFMYVGVTRGMDATGFFAFNNSKGKLHTHKRPIPGFAYAQTKQHSKQLLPRVGDSEFMVVHHRAKTSGGNTMDNAHPFQAKGEAHRLIGVHNGTLTNYRRYEGASNDSACLFQRIADEGLESALQGTSGAYALVWYSFTDKKLYMIRNAQRPLHIMTSLAGGFVFASEAAMLYAVATRAKVGDGHEVLTLETGHVYSWDVTDLGGSRGRNFTKTKIDDAYKAPPQPVVANWSTGSGVLKPSGRSWNKTDDPGLSDAQIQAEYDKHNGITKQSSMFNEQPDAGRVITDNVTILRNPKYDANSQVLSGLATLPVRDSGGKVVDVGADVYSVTKDMWDIARGCVVLPVTCYGVWEAHDIDSWPQMEGCASFLNTLQIIAWYDNYGYRMPNLTEDNAYQLCALAELVDQFEESRRQEKADKAAELQQAQAKEIIH